ncbi:endonuclease [Salmonella phage PST_H2]|uniref:Endonuclease n=1 Tax=Salmonella phage PST_H2 TaxID=2978975 RepID=A0A977TFL3_9CAUD|nr:endonuclease [Salmonella phage PST_H2]
MRKIKQSELKEVRDELIKRQKSKCPICGGSLKAITEINRVVDHCHEHGHIRGVLCRGCNGGIGKIENLIRSYCKAGNNNYFIVKTLRNIADYLELHKTPQTEWIYPKHKTAAELREARNRKARLAYSRKKKEANGG